MPPQKQKQAVSLKNFFQPIQETIVKPIKEGTAAAARSFATSQAKTKETKPSGFIKSLSDFGRAAGEIILSPGTNIAKPILEKGGVSPGVAALAGLGIDIATPLPGKKQEAVFDAAKYVAENVSKREAAKGTGPGLVGSVKDFFKGVKAKLVDANAPIEDTLASSLQKNKMTLLPSEDITNAIDRVYRAPSIASQFVKDKGLEGVIRNVDSLDNLDEYLIAKQAIDINTRGFATGRDLIKDSKLVESFKDKYEPVAQQVHEYSRRLLDYSVDSGLVSRELGERLKQIYPNYVPMNRVFSELEKGDDFFGKKGVANLSRQTIVQRLQGSEREIESPLVSLLGKTYDAFLQGERNKAAKMLAGYEKLPGNPFQLKELTGFKEEFKSGKTRAFKVSPDSTKDTISFLDEGVKRTFETTKEIAAAAKALNPQSFNILARIAAFPSRLLRLTTTGLSVPFVVSNIPRDMVSAFINSKRGLRTSLANPSVYLAALFNAVGHGKLYEEIVRAGGMGTIFDISRNQLPKTLASIRSKKNPVSRIKYLIKTPQELFRAVEDVVGRAEEFTRIKQYAGTKAALLKGGMSEKEAIIESARAAREDTVNFLRRGEWGAVLNATIPYLGAGIQGTRTLLRSLKQRPIATASKIAFSTFFPITMVTSWNLGSDKRKEAYNDIADYEKENNIIIIPPNPTKDENGKWNVFKIPLSPEISSLASIPRRFMEQAYNLDPVRAGEIGRAILGSVQPIEFTDRGVVQSLASGLTPQAIKPALESVTNQNLFTGLPIIPRSLEKLPPELQTKENTSGSARIAGKALDVSPLQVEAFIRGTAGGVGSQALNALDTLLARGGVIPESQIGGESIPANIKRRLAQATGGEIERKLIENIQDAITEQEVEKFELNSKAEQKYSELKAIAEQNKEQANTQLSELSRTDRRLAEAIVDIAQKEKQGLTASDRFLNQLNVANGARAKFIHSLLKDIKGKEERNSYIKSLVEKDVVSAEVYRQLKTLLEKNPI